MYFLFCSNFKPFIFHIKKTSFSDVFKAMFCNPNAIENQTKVLTIEDFESEVVAKLLEFMYKTKLENEGDYCSTELLLLSDKYNVVELRTLCEQTLAESIR